MSTPVAFLKMTFCCIMDMNTQLAIVVLLKLMAKEVKVDHVKHGLSLSKTT